VQDQCVLSLSLPGLVHDEERVVPLRLTTVCDLSSVGSPEENVQPY
jgi:hypothetical protein